MPRGACPVCNRSYELNPQSHFQAACPRCGQLLRVTEAEEERRPAPFRPQAGPTPPAAPAEDPRVIRQGLRTMWWVEVPMVAALCLARPLLFWVVGARRPTLVLTRPASPIVSRSHTVFDQTLFEASEWRTQAKVTVNQERDAAERRDPERATADPEALRLRLLRDPNSGLLQARALAWQAVALARTAAQRYRAADLLVLIEYGTGHPEQALQQARKLVALRPRSRRALNVLRRMAKANGRWALGRAVDARLDALPAMP